jgi:hypothetical protein
VLSAITSNTVTTSSAATTPPRRSLDSFVLRRYGLAIDLLRALAPSISLVLRRSPSCSSDSATVAPVVSFGLQSATP